MADRVTAQEPEQPTPVQAVKLEPIDGVAVKVTALSVENVAEQIVLQVVPAGELVTVHSSPSPLWSL